MYRQGTKPLKTRSEIIHSSFSVRVHGDSCDDDLLRFNKSIEGAGCVGLLTDQSVDTYLDDIKVL